MKITQIETIPVNVPISPERAIRGGRGGHTESPFPSRQDPHRRGYRRPWRGLLYPNLERRGPDYCRPFHPAACSRRRSSARDPTEIERLMASVNAAVANNPFTKAGLEMALWDILGKVAGLPLYRLLGGPVRDSVKTKFSVSGLAPCSGRRHRRLGRRPGLRHYEGESRVGPRRRRSPRRRSPRSHRPPTSDSASTPTAAGQCAPPSRPYLSSTPTTSTSSSSRPPIRTCPGSPTSAAAPICPSWPTKLVYSPQDAMAVARAQAADVLSLYVGKGGITPARNVAAVAASRRPRLHRRQQPRTGHRQRRHDSPRHGHPGHRRRNLPL